MKSLDPQEHRFVLFHAAFTPIAALVVLLSPSHGWGIAISVLLYYFGTISASVQAVNSLWPSIFWFMVPLSIFQVLPDWFLASVLKVLVYPNDGFFKIGPVAAYMAGLWTIPLTVTTFLGHRLMDRSAGPKAVWYGYGAAVGAGLVIFLLSEQLMRLLSSWYAVRVSMLGHIAIYVIPAEIILVVATLYGFRQTRAKGLLAKIGAAFLIMLIYSGALCVSYLVVERIAK